MINIIFVPLQSSSLIVTENLSAVEYLRSVEKLVVTEKLIRKEYGFESKGSTWITANDRSKWKNYKKLWIN